MTILYPNLSYNDVCYKGTALFYINLYVVCNYVFSAVVS